MDNVMVADQAGHTLGYDNPALQEQQGGDLESHLVLPQDSRESGMLSDQFVNREKHPENINIRKTNTTFFLRWCPGLTQQHPSGSYLALSPLARSPGPFLPPLQASSSLWLPGQSWQLLGDVEVGLVVLLVKMRLLVLMLYQAHYNGKMLLVVG